MKLITEGKWVLNEKGRIRHELYWYERAHHAPPKDGTEFIAMTANWSSEQRVFYYIASEEQKKEGFKSFFCYSEEYLAEVDPDGANEFTHWAHIIKLPEDDIGTAAVQNEGE